MIIYTLHSKSDKIRGGSLFSMKTRVRRKPYNLKRPEAFMIFDSVLYTYSLYICILCYILCYIHVHIFVSKNKKNATFIQKLDTALASIAISQCCVYKRTLYSPWSFLGTDYYSLLPFKPPTFTVTLLLAVHTWRLIDPFIDTEWKVIEKEIVSP